MDEQVTILDGRIETLSGRILASWFLFNPNGPTAYAFGHLEDYGRLRFFCRWMHFSGGETYILDDVSVNEGPHAEPTLNALGRLYNHVMTGNGNEELAADNLPSFVKTNGNTEINRN